MKLSILLFALLSVFIAVSARYMPQAKQLEEQAFNAEKQAFKAEAKKYGEDAIVDTAAIIPRGMEIALASLMKGKPITNGYKGTKIVNPAGTKVFASLIGKGNKLSLDETHENGKTTLELALKTPEGKRKMSLKENAAGEFQELIEKDSATGQSKVFYKEGGGEIIEDIVNVNGNNTIEVIQREDSKEKDTAVVKETSNGVDVIAMGENNDGETFQVLDRANKDGEVGLVEVDRKGEKDIFVKKENSDVYMTIAERMTPYEAQVIGKSKNSNGKVVRYYENDDQDGKEKFSVEEFSGEKKEIDTIITPEKTIETTKITLRDGTTKNDVKERATKPEDMVPATKIALAAKMDLSNEINA